MRKLWFVSLGVAAVIAVASPVAMNFEVLISSDMRFSLSTFQ